MFCLLKNPAIAVQRRTGIWLPMAGVRFLAVGEIDDSLVRDAFPLGCWLFQKPNSEPEADAQVPAKEALLKGTSARTDAIARIRSLLSPDTQTFSRSGFQALLENEFPQWKMNATTDSDPGQMMISNFLENVPASYPPPSIGNAQSLWAWHFQRASGRLASHNQPSFSISNTIRPTCGMDCWRHANCRSDWRARRAA